MIYGSFVIEVPFCLCNVINLNMRRISSVLYAVTTPAKPRFHSLLFNFEQIRVSRIWLVKPGCLNSVGLSTYSNSQLGLPSPCSEIASFEQKMFGCSSNTNDEIRVRSFGVDNNDTALVYATVMDNSLAYQKMEKSLDEHSVNLTTDLVVEVLTRLRFEDKIALRFFMWAGDQENYAHEVRAYNEMIDILTCTKYKVKQYRIVCDMLDYMKRHDKKRVPVDVLLKILRDFCDKYLSHVQKFAKKKRIRVKTQPEVNAFNLLLDSLCKCGLVEYAEALCKRVKNKVTFNANTFNIMFFGWCRLRNPKRGMEVLEEMIQLGHTPDNFTYNTGIDAFCKVGMVMEAVELFEFMRIQGSTMSSPTAKTYAILIVALVQNDKMEECFTFLGHMISSGCVPDVSTYKEIIEGICLAGKIDEAYKFLDEMGNKGYPPDIMTYNCFLKILCENKKSSEAFKLYERMIELGCMPSVQTYNMLISMFFEMGDLDMAYKTWGEMDEKGCTSDIDTYCVMIDGLFGCNKVKDACFLIDEVVKKGLKMPFRQYDSFLMQLSVVGDLSAIHRLSEHMRKFYNSTMARRFALGQKKKSMSLRGK